METENDVIPARRHTHHRHRRRKRREISPNIHFTVKEALPV